MADFRKIFPGLLALLILASVFWGPAIFAGKTLIHGDSLGHGLALLDLQSRSLHDLGQLLWSDKIYGGHALFAEGQGGFANPVNMIFAWIVAPLTGSIYAENLFHWFCTVWTGLGIVLLCRSLGLGAWSSCLGAIAAAFSLDTIAQSQNLTVAGALTWVPWALWTMERWLAKATTGRALALGASIALEVYSGYPEILDGIVLYMAILVVTHLSDGAARGRWLDAWRPRLGSLALAVLVAIGLSAVQILPELELVGQSHRSGGISIPYQVPIIAYLRGFLFTRTIAGSVDYFPLIGSLFISMLGTLLLALPTSRSIKGHMVGTAFLIVLGMGNDTWLFRFIYRSHLLPELHYFRVLLVYINVACLTAGVLAAAGSDALSKWAASRRSTRGSERNRARMQAAILGLFLLFWAWAVWRLFMPDSQPVQFAVVAIAIAGTLVAMLLRSAEHVSLLMALLLIGETGALRANSFYFGDRALLRKPSSIAAIQAVPDWNDFKIFSESLAPAFALTPPTSPELVPKVERAWPAAGGMANLLWDLHSMDGALALALGRRAAISQMLDDEAHGRNSAPPGARLMDMLGVRWVVFDDPHLAGDAYRDFWHETSDSVWIMENPAARPRFQLFAGCRSVSSLDAALSTVGALQAPTLIVEKRDAADPCTSGADPSAPTNAHFQLLKAKSTRYHLTISAAAPVWLFLADANYPGWNAYLDGTEVPIYSAEVLGKAVAVPAGDHDLWIRFQSRSFELGASITLVTLVATGIVGISAIRRGRRA